MFRVFLFAADDFGIVPPAFPPPDRARDQWEGILCSVKKCCGIVANKKRKTTLSERAFKQKATLV